MKRVSGLRCAAIASKAADPHLPDDIVTGVGMRRCKRLID